MDWKMKLKLANYVSYSLHTTACFIRNVIKVFRHTVWKTIALFGQVHAPSESTLELCDTAVVVYCRRICKFKNNSYSNHASYCKYTPGVKILWTKLFPSIPPRNACYKFTNKIQKNDVASLNKRCNAGMCHVDLKWHHNCILCKQTPTNDCSLK